MLTPLWLLGQQTTRHEAQELLFPHGSGGTVGLSAGRGQRNALPTWAGDGGQALSIYSPASEVSRIVASQVPKLLGWDKTWGGPGRIPVTSLVRCAGQTEDSHFLLGETAQSLLVWVVEAT